MLGETVVVATVAMGTETVPVNVLFAASCHLTLQVGVPLVGVPDIEAVEPTVNVKPFCVAAPLTIDQVTAPVEAVAPRLPLLYAIPDWAAGGAVMPRKGEPQITDCPGAMGHCARAKGASSNKIRI
jgi:hypothetical protein